MAKQEEITKLFQYKFILNEDILQLVTEFVGVVPTNFKIKKRPDQYGFCDIALTSNDTVLFTATSDGLSQWWDVQTGAELKSQAKHDEIFFADSNGDNIIVSDDSRTTLWDSNG